MAKIDAIIKERLLSDIISHYTDKELESEHCGHIIPIIYYNNLRGLRATRKGVNRPSELRKRINKLRYKTLWLK